MSLLKLTSRLWQAFLLLLASFQLLRVSCFLVAGLSAIANIPGETNCVVGVSAVTFEHAVVGGPAVTGFLLLMVFLLLLASLLILVSLF